MTTTRINHTGHGHANTARDRAACRKFMADHDGMDQVTFRVAQREAELDDAFEYAITTATCSMCGNTNPEDVSGSYSVCCNKVVL